MAVPIALVTFSWNAQPSPLPPGASAVASYNLLVTSAQGYVVLQKTGIPATTTSYTTSAADTSFVLTGSGNPYKVAVSSVDAAGVLSLTPGVVQFEAVPPVYSPPVPQGVTVGQVTWQ